MHLSLAVIDLDGNCFCFACPNQLTWDGHSSHLLELLAPDHRLGVLLQQKLCLCASQGGDRRVQMLQQVRLGPLHLQARCSWLSAFCCTPHHASRISCVTS